MKRLLLLSLFTLLGRFSLCAQEAVTMRPATEVVSAHWGCGQVRNTYLTPLLYSGSTYGLELQRWRLQRQLRWVNWQQVDAAFTMAQDGGMHSDEWAGRLRYRYGVQHRWQTSARDWTFAVGPYVGASVGFDYNIKMGSSNNPATVRATAGLGAAGTVSYRFAQPAMQGTSLMLQLQTPLLGAALQPEYGASYYEVFGLRNSSNNIHFTSLHCRQDFDAQFAAHLPVSLIPGCRWSDAVIRVGAAWHIETMRLHQVTTRYSSFDLVIGWVYQYLPFGRHKSSSLSRSAYEAY